MPYVTSDPVKIYTEDVQFSSSVSEAVANKIGAGINFVLDNFVAYSFGISGGFYSNLAFYPYTFTGSIESLVYTCVINDIVIFSEASGISGTSEFSIEWQPAAGGAWTNIFSTNLEISNTASDNLTFKMSALSAPTGVTLPILSTSSFAAGDKLRLVIVSAANQASNIKFKVITRPI